LFVGGVLIMPLSALLDVAGLGRRVEQQLMCFMLSRLSTSQPGSVDRSLAQPIMDLVLARGKRLRAAFCYWGWRGAGGADCDGALAAAAALELLHAFALIHDDVMDASLLRRGHPTLHQQFAARHTAQAWLGCPGEFGAAAAILAGDLCAVWADMLLRESGLSPIALRRGAAVYDAMREQTIHGQYLDLVTQAEGTARVADAWRVARAKTAASTTSGPLAFGAAVAGAGDALQRAYAAYAEPLGVAFQLRDDLLGAFGDPAVTGKPSGDDLRDGKCTLLLAHARRVGGPRASRRIDELLRARSDDAVGELRNLIKATGARGFVEQRISALGRTAIAALDATPIGAEPHRVLSGLALALTGPVTLHPVPGTPIRRQ
jgi:geranylgeranyl diphosphate synthase type I